MLREIYEQPDAIRRTLALYLHGQSFDPQAVAPLADWLNPRGEVLIAASGSSRHAGLAGEIMIEDLSGIPVDVEYSSEYCYRSTHAAADPLLPLMIWYGIEPLVPTDKARSIKLLTTCKIPQVRQFITRRLAVK